MEEKIKKEEIKQEEILAQIKGLVNEYHKSRAKARSMIAQVYHDRMKAVKDESAN